MIDYQPAIEAGVLTDAQANALSAAIVERDGATYVDLGLLADDEMEALDRLVVWVTMGRAQ